MGSLQIPSASCCRIIAIVNTDEMIYRWVAPATWESHHKWNGPGTPPLVDDPCLILGVN